MPNQCNVLNPGLYERMSRACGTVIVANRGMPLIASPMVNSLVGITNPQRPERLLIKQWGESYCINCFRCHDTRHRLWVNHHWDVPYEGRSLHSLVKCFNENCQETYGFADELSRRLKPYIHKSLVLTPVIRQATAEEVENSNKLQEIQLPPDFISVKELPERHLVVDYLRERGMDIQSLADVWNVGWSLSASRIIVPIYHFDDTQNKLLLVGYQGRFFNPYTGNDKPPVKEIPKWLTSRGLKKSCVLFNGYRARNYDMPVFTEGPLDAIRVGPEHGVAIFGHILGFQQGVLIGRYWSSRPAVAVAALDPDKPEANVRLVHELKGTFRNVINAKLAKDPSDYTDTELWEVITNASENN